MVENYYPTYITCLKKNLIDSILIGKLCGD